MLRISIVTICYNEVTNISATMESVFAQTYRNIEYVIKDGGSTDGTLEKIKQLVNSHSSLSPFTISVSSGKDGGLYNGMNAGLSRCSGDYVLFCNAGDRLASPEMISQMVDNAENEGLPDMVYGDCEDILDGKHFTRIAHGPGFIRFGMPASHEAIFYKLSLVRQLGLQYDPTYRISADYKFTYRFVNAAKSFSRLSKTIVVFSEGGVSTTNKWRGLMEGCRVRREVSGMSALSRLWIFILQSGVLTLSIYCAPLYRKIRLSRANG